MNCKTVRELLMTDYTDGETDAKLHKEIKEHIKGCFECAEFEKNLRDTAVTPFKNIEEIKPPESVWNNIKAEIEQEPAVGFIRGLKDSLESIIILRRPVFALATLGVILLVAAIFFRAPYSSNKGNSDQYLGDQIGFLVELEESGNDYGDSLGTSIEEFLL